MATVIPSVKLAVLIDADNTSRYAVSFVLAEIAKFGTAFVKRAYGDWASAYLSKWKPTLLENSIQPMQQFAYTTGKNSTDSAMIIDAMDLLYSNKFDGFCIVSSDSDFTRLASRIRESGLVVYGCGERKTPKPFVTACDRFIYIENLVPNADAAHLNRPEGTTVTVDLPPPPLTQSPPTKRKKLNGEGEKPEGQVPTATGIQEVDKKLKDSLRQAVEVSSDEEGWAHLADVGHLVSQWHPDFDPRTYGFKKLRELVASTSLFEIRMRSPGPGKPELAYARCIHG
ncbi:hypothetical protein NW768_007517 [Fusarium equiseti]|uniref:HTH OST-type domain-containing protein n=1 Tax=Fusarium equiseti TaxID=61235 RepID=A0ABQ8R7X1_FUSEQ|nr:hypothetical protein NW768_007517 [Fusarium equiseti]